MNGLFEEGERAGNAGAEAAERKQGKRLRPQGVVIEFVGQFERDHGLRVSRSCPLREADRPAEPPMNLRLQRGPLRRSLERLPAQLDRALQVTARVLDVTEQDECLRGATCLRLVEEVERELSGAPRVGRVEVGACRCDRAALPVFERFGRSEAKRVLGELGDGATAPRRPGKFATSSSAAATSASGGSDESARCRARSAGSLTMAAS